MAVVRKKQDDKNLKILREIVTSGAGNRECFDCGQKGPTYVNMTIGSFVCTRCSGVLRGLTPPHRVKSISMATFTPDEIEFLKLHGNDFCGKTWLGLWDPKRVVHQDQRELMIDKYERKRYYLEPASPLKSLANVVTSSSSSNNYSSSSNTTTNHNNTNNNNNNNNSSSSNTINNHNNSFNTNMCNGGNSNNVDNSFKNITLTPPTSTRLQNGGSANGNNFNTNSHNQMHHKDENIVMNGHNNHHHHHQNHQNQNNNNNQHYQPRPVVTNKASLNISSSLDSGVCSSNNSSNGFTPDSDFVADFNTANIFNAAPQQITQQHHQPQHTNGFQTAASAQLNNGTGGNHTNGFLSHSNANENFADFDHAPIYNAAANQIDTFKDFNVLLSHFTANNSIQKTPTILNSTIEEQQHQQQQQQQPIYSNTCSSSSSSQAIPTTNNNVVNLNRSSDNNNCTSYPNFGINNTIATPTNNTSNHNGGFNQQWSVWQQFPWPSPQTTTAAAAATTSTSTQQLITTEHNEKPNHHQQQYQHYQQQQSNRWSLPISTSTTSNSLSSSATFNSSSSLNSTPPADRYAALKDLDEQLREIKVAPPPAVPAVYPQPTNEHFSNGSSSANANPFKTSPPMPIQSNQQLIPNPFQANLNGNGNVNGNGILSNGVLSNGGNSFNTNGGLFDSPPAQQSYQQQQQQQQQQQNFLNHQHHQLQQNFNNNGFGNTTPNFGMFNFSNGNGSTATSTGANNINNGCYQTTQIQQQQQQIAQSPVTMISTGANGCGMMGFGAVHQIAAGSNAMSNMKNPFVGSSSLNSNNPFL